MRRARGIGESNGKGCQDAEVLSVRRHERDFGDAAKMLPLGRIPRCGWGFLLAFPFGIRSFRVRRVVSVHVGRRRSTLETQLFPRREQCLAVLGPIACRLVGDLDHVAAGATSKARPTTTKRETIYCLGSAERGRRKVKVDRGNAGARERVSRSVPVRQIRTSAHYRTILRDNDLSHHPGWHFSFTRAIYLHRLRDAHAAASVSSDFGVRSADIGAVAGNSRAPRHALT